MLEKARDVIPPDILEAAREAGLSDPMWYVGRRMRKDFRLKHGLGKVVREAREEAGLDPPTLMDSPALPEALPTETEANPPSSEEIADKPL